jgi:excisionase family DNA binding protein
MKKPRMLTIDEAAQCIDGLTKFRIRQMCISGELKHVRAGKKYLINQAVLFATIGEDFLKYEQLRLDDSE